MDTNAILRAFSALYGATGKEEQDQKLMGDAPPVEAPAAPLAVSLPSESVGSGQSHRVSLTTKSAPSLPPPAPWAKKAEGAAAPAKKPGLDDDLLLAYAQLSDDRFRHAMGRAGNRIGQAFAGGKVDNSAYDAADKASQDDTVGKVQALREGDKKRQALALGDLKLNKGLEEQRPGSDVSRAAVTVAKSMFPEADPSVFDGASYATISAVLGEAKPLFDAKVKFALANASNGATSMTVTHETESDTKRKIADALALNAETGASRAKVQREQTVAVGYEDQDGTKGRANNQYVTAFNNLNNDYQRIDSVAGKLLSTYERVGPQAWPSVDKAQMESDVLMLHQYLNKANANGVMNPGDKHDLEGLLPDLNTFRSFLFSDIGPSRIRNVVQNVGQELENRRSTANWKPVTSPDTRPGGAHDPAQRPQQLGKAPPRAATATSVSGGGLVRLKMTKTGQESSVSPGSADVLLKMQNPDGTPKYQKVTP